MTKKIPDHSSTQNQFISSEIPTDSRQARQIARRHLMAETIIAEGTIRIEDLTERFGVSLMTAHRDLDELESRGILRKTRGIVSAAPTSLVESSDVYRDTQQFTEKSAIAAAAAQFVESGQAIFLDDSTTVARMIPHLPAKVPLTAVTNSLTLMAALKDIRDVTLLGLGGQFHHWCNAFLGHVTTQQIQHMRADLAFISMSAISDDITFHQSPEMVDIKRAMFASASKRILLADHTKFDRRALYAMCPLTDFDSVIVDEGTPPLTTDHMMANGINVIVVESAATQNRSETR